VALSSTLPSRFCSGIPQPEAPLLQGFGLSIKVLAQRILMLMILLALNVLHGYFSLLLVVE
jgi:hypothetical protein